MSQLRPKQLSLNYKFQLALNLSALFTMTELDTTYN